MIPMSSEAVATLDPTLTGVDAVNNTPQLFREIFGTEHHLSTPERNPHAQVKDICCAIEEVSNPSATACPLKVWFMTCWVVDVGGAFVGLPRRQT